MDLFRYWIKIFALVFGMGVVSGIVMSYQFGTNWAVFSDKAGPIIGPLMAYEVLTAFFLEAGFLGVMLFGMNRVGKGLHFTATLMVALGTFVSAARRPLLRCGPTPCQRSEDANMDIDLTLIWAFIIVLAVFIYVVLDGFDLGIGIFFRRFPVGQDRDTAMNSIAPVWDGNETWLVMGGGGLLAAFPLA